MYSDYIVGQKVKILSNNATGFIKSLKTTFAVVSLDGEFIEKGKNNSFPDIKSKIVKYNNLKPL